MNKNPPLIYIEWCDAISDTPKWVSGSDAIAWCEGEDWIIKQSGFLLMETKEYILMASKYNPHSQGDDMFFGLHKIPKTWIRKRKNLKS